MEQVNNIQRSQIKEEAPAEKSSEYKDQQKLEESRNAEEAVAGRIESLAQVGKQTLATV